MAAVLGGVVVFLFSDGAWGTTLGVLGAAILGGGAAALVWLAWNRANGLRPVAKLVDLPHIGQIPSTPETPSPTLTAPASGASIAYQRAASRLEASTKGRVLLVSGMSPGQGATTASLNLAIAATRAGRRTLLIDGDLAQARLSRFGTTGVSPGLAELSRGDADLAEASRLWSIDSSSRLPFIPAGTPTNGQVELDRRGLADAVEDLTTAADLVLIDTSANGAALDALGTLADGTLLVLPKAAGQATIDAARHRVEQAGAPAIGYVVNDAAPSPPSINQHPVLRSLKRGLATALLVLLAYGGWNAAQIWSSWRGVERQGLNQAEAAELLPLTTDIDIEGLGDDVATAITATPRADGDFLAVLVVGADLSEELADVIVLVVIPANGDDPVMMSLPRDLYLPNRCTQSLARINAALSGCGDDVTGATLLALTVEDFTGIQVDHFALFTFEGFEQIIDELGGYEVCVDYPVRDAKSHLDLPAGCTQASGEQTLAWVRSRRTQEEVDGRWRTMADVSDLTRNERQQEVILDMFTRLGDFSSLSDLTRAVRSLTNTFELDDQLGLSEAINLAWDLRSIDPNQVVRLDIPVHDQTTSSGAAVLVPSESFDAILAEHYPDLAPMNQN